MRKRTELDERQLWQRGNVFKHAFVFLLAALAAEGRTRILDSKCVDVSYPAFYDTFEELL